MVKVTGGWLGQVHVYSMRERAVSASVLAKADT